MNVWYLQSHSTITIRRQCEISFHSGFETQNVKLNWVETKVSYITKNTGSKQKIFLANPSTPGLM